MKVRTLAVFVPQIDKFDEGAIGEVLDKAAVVIAQAHVALTGAGYEVQTTRVISNWADVFVQMPHEECSAAMLRLEAMLAERDITLFNLGRLTSIAGVRFVPDILSVSKRTSISADLPMAGSVHTAAEIEHAHAVAEAVLRLAHVTTNGEGSFRFCASARAVPGIPFFPAGFSSGEGYSLALGVENSTLVAEAFRSVGAVFSDGRTAGHPAVMELAESRLRQLMHGALQPLCELAAQAAAAADAGFMGVDPSICPSLAPEASLARAFEQLGVGAFGEAGTLAVCAMVTRAVKSLAAGQEGAAPRAGLPLVGYAGLMLPPLEDAGLAQCVMERRLDVPKLLMYSSVCGIGIDCVPIAGDTPAARITALLLDVSALAHRLHKPLSCRLFPVVGARAGDMTAFHSPYLCNTLVMHL